MEGDVIDGREQAELVGRRSVGRQLLAWPRHISSRLLGPAAHIAGGIGVVGMDDGEFPHPVFLHHLVFVDRGAERGRGPEVQLLQQAHAHLAVLPVRRHVDDRLQLQMIAQAARRRPFLAAAEHRDQHLAHVIAALVDAALRQFHAAVLGEQMRQL